MVLSSHLCKVVMLLLFPRAGAGKEAKLLFAQDTLYTAVQSAGEVKASEMVHDAT